MNNSVAPVPGNDGPDPRLPFEPAVALKNIQESPLKVAYIGINDGLLLTNASFRKAFGVPSTHENFSVFNILHSKDHAAYSSAKKHLCDELYSTLSRELSCKNSEGGFQRYFVTLSVVRSPVGIAQYMRAIFRDSQEKREVDSKISSGDLADQGHLYVTAVNKEGVFIKSEGELAWNVIPKIVGRHFTEVYEGIPEIQARIRRAMCGEYFDVEVYWSGLWYHVWYRPLLDEHGAPAGAIWTAQSVDHEKQKELRLRAAVEEQQRATHVREEMLSMAAHEIRGPLSTLSMHIQVLEMMIEGGSTSAEILDYANTLVGAGRRQIEHVSKLVERTLDVSRMKERGLGLECRPFDFVPLVKEVVRKCRERFGDSCSPVNLALPDKFTGYWDPLRMEQVVENLVSNALKYGEGSPITVHLDSNRDRAVLSVIDGGPGISCEDQKKIFDRFERGSSCKGAKGFGMGLYIVKQIVEAHGGTISVKSDAGGRGSEFKAEIPIVTSAPR